MRHLSRVRRTQLEVKDSAEKAVDAFPHSPSLDILLSPSALGQESVIKPRTVHSSSLSASHL
jgi:hypothetical protein